jgi:hypothetical protein
MSLIVVTVDNHSVNTKSEMFTKKYFQYCGLSLGNFPLEDFSGLISEWIDDLKPSASHCLYIKDLESIRSVLCIGRWNGIQNINVRLAG